MRILLDEDSPVQLLEALSHVLPKHQVDHVTKLRAWSGKKDLSIYRDAKRRGYDIVVTNDSSQLDDPEETRAIKRSEVHHVRYRHRHHGMEGLALAIGAVIAAMPSIVATLEEVDGQRLVRVKGLSTTPNDRFDMIDPAATPPKYWRR